MKRVVLVTVIIFAATLVFILVQTMDATAGSKDRVCVMHREDGKYVEKWIQPKSLDGHMGHGDKPCPPSVDPWQNVRPELYFPIMLKRLVDPLMTP